MEKMIANYKLFIANCKLNKTQKHIEPLTRRYERLLTPATDGCSICNLKFAMTNLQ
jgi:hypothetical protein